MDSARTSRRVRSRREPDSSTRAPPSRAVNHGTECAQPSSPCGGVTPSSRTSPPPCPEAGRTAAAQSSFGRPVRPAAVASSMRMRPSLHDAFTDPARTGDWPVPAGQKGEWGGRNHSGKCAGGHPAKACPEDPAGRPGVPSGARGETCSPTRECGSLVRVAERLMRAPLSKALEWSEAVPGVGALVHVTERHLCFKGGRVKIASTGAEEAASEQGQQAQRFRDGVFGAG